MPKQKFPLRGNSVKSKGDLYFLAAWIGRIDSTSMKDLELSVSNRKRRLVLDYSTGPLGRSNRVKILAAFYRWLDRTPIRGRVDRAP